MNEAVIGKIFYTSWGYDQTNINMLKVLRLSNTGKTAFCQMVRKKVIERQMTYDNVGGTHETFGDEFKLRVKRNRDNTEIHLRGSYPYCHDGSMERGTRRDSFSEWDGTPIYETNPMFGH